MAQYKGPVRPGYSEKTFRETGKSQRKYQGPVRPGTDVEKFRSTGGGGSPAGRRRAKAAAEAAKVAARTAAKAASVKAAADKATAARASEALVRETLLRTSAQSQLNRIQEQRARIIAQGGRTRTQRFIDSKTKADIEQRVTEINKIVSGRRIKGKIFERTNLDTGETTIIRFDPINSGSLRRTGSISYTKDVEGINTTERGIRKTEFDRLNTGVKAGKITIAERDKMYSNYIKSRNVKISQARPSTGVVEAVKDSSKYSYLEKSQNWLGQKLDKLETERFRTSGFSMSQLNIGALTAFFAVGAGAVSFVKGVTDIPQSIYLLAKNPSLFKQIPGALEASAKMAGKELRVSPTRTIVKLGVEYWLMAGGAGKVLRVVKRLKTNTISRLSPRFRAIKNSAITIKMSKSAKSVKLKVGTIKTLKQPLSKQAALAGTTRPVVTTAMADRLLTFFSRKKTIRKPLPGGIEAKLSPRYKRLLEKFDNNKIKIKEFKLLETHLQTKYGKSLLERSLYVDPTGSIRVSRLGIGKDAPTASIRDILKGNFKLREAKPQIIIFKDIVVESFPRTKIFKSIKLKLRRNKALNMNEIVELVKWQTKKSGKFKPVGSTTFSGGVEPELTLAPGELIKRVKSKGFTIVKGRKVPIVEAKVIKGSKKLNILLDRFQKSKTIKYNKRLKVSLSKEMTKPVKLRNSKYINAIKSELKSGASLTKKESSLLKKLYKKETRVRFDTRQARNIMKRPVLRPRILSKLSRVSRITSAVRKRIPTGRVKVRGKRGRGKIKRTTTRTGRPKARATSRVPSARTKVRAVRPTARVSRGRGITPTKKIITPMPPTTPTGKIKKLRKSVQRYRVVVKKRGKQVKLRELLTKVDAKNKLAYELDHSLARTGRLEAVGRGKVVNRLPSKYSGAFAKIKRKLRPYKIVRKNKRGITGYIEKRKYGIDTRKEKLQIKNLRIKAARKTHIRSSKKKQIARRKLAIEKTIRIKLFKKKVEKLRLHKKKVASMRTAKKLIKKKAVKKPWKRKQKKRLKPIKRKRKRIVKKRKSSVRRRKKK